MIDYSELKRLAVAIESCTSIPEEDEAAWMRRTTGEAVVVLLDELDERKAENERQSDQFKEWQASHHANYVLVAEERDQLKAEVEALRKDAIRYQWLCNGNGYFMEEQGICGHSEEKTEADAAIDYAMANGCPP